MKSEEITTPISILIIAAAIFYSFWVLMPRTAKPLNAPETEFSAERAAIHLKEISKEKHPSGTPEALLVRDYLTTQLKCLGLKPEIQSGEVMVRWSRKKVTIHNILTRIEGSGKGKALLVLAHYDSAPFSYGASDDGSGIVTILEWVRAHLASNKKTTNDIIILFTDGEEKGMLGAKLFTQSHEWAKDVGFAMNFEARGSGGPGFTLVETNSGNANMMKLYDEAGLKYPLATSLFYSVYKLLPNDGDSRILRERLDIDGFLFAFMDDHFDYHKPTDNYQNADLNSIQHQGSYLMPLADVFANTDLSQVKTNENVVFFNFPFLGLITYSYDLILPLLFIAISSFLIIITYGFRLNRLSWRKIGKGSLQFFALLIICSLIGYFGGNYIPDLALTNRMPVNGHIYTLFFVFLCSSIFFLVSLRFSEKGDKGANFMIAPILFWILANIAIAYFLKGASYFIIPVLFALINLLLTIKSNRPTLLINTLLSVPMMFILAPMIKFFPLALGPRIMISATLVLVLMLGLMQTTLSQLKFRKTLSIGFFFLSTLSLVFALATK